MIWTQPKQLGHDQNNLYPSKTIWTVQNHFGPIEVQGIMLLRSKLWGNTFWSLHVQIWSNSELDNSRRKGEGGLWFPQKHAKKSLPVFSSIQFVSFLYFATRKTIVDFQLPFMYIRSLLSVVLKLELHFVREMNFRVTSKKSGRL